METVYVKEENTQHEFECAECDFKSSEESEMIDHSMIHLCTDQKFLDNKGNKPGKKEDDPEYLQEDDYDTTEDEHEDEIIEEETKIPPKKYKTKRLKNADAIALCIFRQHGVLPITPKCQNPQCDGNPLKGYGPDKSWKRWKCNKTYAIKRNKEKKVLKWCNYTVSDCSGTFLENAHLSPAKILLYLSYWCRNDYKHSNVEIDLRISNPACIRNNNKCNEVCEKWFREQQPIGGPGFIIEICETVVTLKKYIQGEVLKEAWCLGGKERHGSKKLVIFLLEASDSEELDRELVETLKQDADYLTPYIKKYVRPGSIVMTDECRGYSKLSELGYEHYVVNPSEVNDNCENPFVHTHEIERLLGDLNEWMERLFIPSNRGRPTIKSNDLKYYIARYICLHQEERKCLTNFLCIIGELYPHKADSRFNDI